MDEDDLYKDLSLACCDCWDMDVGTPTGGATAVLDTMYGGLLGLLPPIELDVLECDI